jgi:hypothetical protein
MRLWELSDLDQDWLQCKLQTSSIVGEGAPLYNQEISDQENKGKNQIMGPRGGSETKKDWPNGRRP